MKNKIIIDGEKKMQLCLDIKNIEDLIKNPINIDECVIRELTFQNVEHINTDFNDMKINIVKFLDSKTHIIEGSYKGSFRNCGIEILVFAPGGDDDINICNDTFRDNIISILDIDRESSDINIGMRALQDNIIEKVKLKTTGEICIHNSALKNNIIRSFIIEGMPKKIIICEEALENNEIKELKLQATDTISISADALINNPIESIYLDAPNIQVKKEFFDIKTLKVLCMPKNVYNKDYKKYSEEYFEGVKRDAVKIKFTEQ